MRSQPLSAVFMAKSLTILMGTLLAFVEEMNAWAKGAEWGPLCGRGLPGLDSVLGAWTPVWGQPQPGLLGLLPLPHQRGQRDWKVLFATSGSSGWSQPPASGPPGCWLGGFKDLFPLEHKGSKYSGGVSVKSTFPYVYSATGALMELSMVKWYFVYIPGCIYYSFLHTYGALGTKPNMLYFWAI